MSSSPAQREKTPELREFIKEHSQKVYDFAWYMLHGSADVDDCVVALFQEFSRTHRKLISSQRTPAAGELRLELFSLAWSLIQNVARHSDAPLRSGRDLRQFRETDRNLLDGTNEKNETYQDAVAKRLLLIDLPVRAPLVLRDILSFSDDEICRILGLRWPVYRHRLHRGRVDFRDALRGWPLKMDDRKNEEKRAEERKTLLSV